MACLLFCLSEVINADHYDHPRLFFLKADESALKSRIDSDPLAQKIYAEMIRRTDEILILPATKYQIPDGKRLLGESRYALRNILHTAMAWRMTQDKKYFNRAVLELEASCQFENWNTSHFLDTAEMSTAVAIGYDWLYNDLSSHQRKHFAQALKKLGLEPARNGYIGKPNAWWSNLSNNWTQVCASGLIITERALEEKGDPIHQARIAARDRLDDCRSFYLPHGGYPEGPGYWHYGSIYHVLGIAATRNDQEKMALSTTPEFERSALFPIQLTGPTGYAFNFADSGSVARSSGFSAAQAWMIREFDDPSSIAYLRKNIEVSMNQPKDLERYKDDRFFPFMLLWLPKSSQRETLPFSLDSEWQGIQPIATFRSSWSDPHSMFFAIKGGLSNVSHGHMDVGSFVFDASGVRWVEDLGSDNYNLPGYFQMDDERWKYFRMNNFSHSTLVIGKSLQQLTEKSSPLTKFVSTPKQGQFSIDMSPAYHEQAAQVLRTGVFNREHKIMTLTDSIKSPKDSVRWAIMTKAEIEISGKVVILKSNDKKLILTRRDQHGGEWKILSAKPSIKDENQNVGYQMLAFTAPVAEKLELEVTFEPKD